ncbi:MAG TPA: HD domain-containing protein [Candidatus Gracilibacteria bacterium]
MDFDDFIIKVGAKQGSNVDAITRAYQLAERTHRHQKRKSGEPYITHPVAVANIIFDIGGDGTMICAALLHDVLEDSEEREETEKALKAGFSNGVYYLVHALSKDSNVTDKMEQQTLFFAQLEDALKTDISVFFIKLADLIHNLGTINGLKPAKKAIWLDELRFQYMPLFQDYYHKVAPAYHEMYREIMDRLELMLQEHAQKDPI